MTTLMKIQHDSGVLEYRVLSQKSNFAYAVPLLPLFLSLKPSWLSWLLLSSTLLFLLAPRTLYESIFIFTNLGLQLETSRGWFGVPLFVTSEFIPATAIRDIIINEALSGWQFKHYLAVLQDGPPESHRPQLSVAYQNALPPVSLLSEIYRHLHEDTAGALSPQCGHVK